MKLKESCLEYCKDIHLISALFYLFFQQLSHIRIFLILSKKIVIILKKKFF